GTRREVLNVTRCSVGAAPLRASDIIRCSAGSPRPGGLGCHRFHLPGQVSDTEPTTGSKALVCVSANGDGVRVAPASAGIDLRLPAARKVGIINHGYPMTRIEKFEIPTDGYVFDFPKGLYAVAVSHAIFDGVGRRHPIAVAVKQCAGEQARLAGARAGVAI